MNQPKFKCEFIFTSKGIKTEISKWHEVRSKVISDGISDYIVC